MWLTKCVRASLKTICNYKTYEKIIPHTARKMPGSGAPMQGSVHVFFAGRIEKRGSEWYNNTLNTIRKR